MNKHPRLAGVMGFNYTPPNPDWMKRAVADLCAVCDDVFLLAEDYEEPILCEIRKAHDNIRSVMFIEHPEKPLWNDFSSHCLLMMEAARYGCQWLFWIDHDECLWPAPDKSIVRALVDSLHADPVMVSAQLPWLTAWDDEQHVRTNIGYMNMKKNFLQRNPFLDAVVCFTSTPMIRLHDWPIQTGKQIYRQDIGVMHYGLMTREQRIARVNRYQVPDEHNPKRWIVPKSIEEYDAGATVKPLSEVKLSDYQYLTG